MAQSTEKQALEAEETRDEEVEMLKDMIVDYCQNTGVYTLRQITEPTRYKIRRLYWIALLIAGFCIFSLQTYESSMRFLSREVAASIKINYNDSIRFPAVTLCNQNAFRATKVNELGIYKELSEVFTTNQLNKRQTSLYTHEEQLLYNMSMADLFTSTAHSQSDFIVKCQWDDGDCSHDDIVSMLTDHGICYTFNKARPGFPVKQVDRAGLINSLQLSLNLEQYEYMVGPNYGAGIRILLHDQLELPPVKDNSIAIPPGAYALVGGEIVSVENLKEPYGKCEDDLDLKYYNKYSKESCSADCIERLIVEHCGCRDYYMLPDKRNQGSPPVCTVYQHFNCVRPYLDFLHQRISTECSCPISCQYTSVSTTVSYGSTSNFDMEKTLQGNTTTLQRKYLHARETNQRVNNVISNADRLRITALNSVVVRISNIFKVAASRLERCVHELHEVLHVVEERSEFHAGRALHEVQYMMTYNFKRYWTVQSERVLDHVTREFYPFGSSVERVVESLCGNTTQPAGDETMRQLMWYPIENQLFTKLDLVTRALDIFQDVNQSYATAQPLGNYRVTINRLYDKTFLPIELFEPMFSKQKSYFRSVDSHTTRMKTESERLLSIGRDCVQNDTYDSDYISETISSYEYRCKRYNYYIFLLNDRIISNPLELITKTKEDFETLMQELEDRHDMLEDIKNWMKDILAESNSQFLRNVQELSIRAMGYLSDTTQKKVDLAEFSNSAIMTESVQNTTRLLNELLNRGQNFADGLQRVKKSYLALYATMLGEPTTKAFYQRIQKELYDVIGNHSLASYYIPLFESLLGRPFDSDNYEDLVTLMNADIVDLNLTFIEEETDKYFNEFLILSDVKAIVGNVPDEFDSAVTELRQSLRDFSEGNKLGPAFFRENFLSVSVFLKDLSYTEIAQQVAYDQNNLVGDIGGSAGLFVGASLVTLFEIFDLLCLGLCALKEKLYKRTTRKKQGQKNNMCDVKVDNSTNSSSDVKICTVDNSKGSPFSLVKVYRL